MEMHEMMKYCRESGNAIWMCFQYFIFKDDVKGNLEFKYMKLEQH